MDRTPWDSRWKPIQFFDEYWISNYGQVFNIRLGILMAQTVTSSRTHLVQMSQYGKRRTMNVNELRKAAFPEEEPEIGYYGRVDEYRYFYGIIPQNQSQEPLSHVG